MSEPGRTGSKGNMVTRRRGWRAGVLAAAVVALVCSAVAACGSSATASNGEVTLVVGTDDTFGWVPTFPADGAQNAPGVKIQIDNFVGGSNEEIAALNSGKIDVAELGQIGPVVAQAGGVQFKIIAATTPWPQGQGIIVAKNSPIKTVAELKGKTVSYSRGTNSEWTLLKALNSVGLNLSDIDSVTLPDGANAQELLNAGKLDAAVVIDPTLTTYLDSGSRLLINGTNIDAENPLFYIASDTALSTKKAAIATFVRQLAKHIAWADANPAKAADLTAKLNGISPAVALQAELKRPTGLTPISQALVQENQQVANDFYQVKVINAPINVAQVFTTEFNKDLTP